MAIEESAHQLVNVVTLLVSAVIVVPLFKRLGLGSVLGYLAAGLAIGPFGLKLFTDSQSILHIAELGVVMFLFIIGLEMKPSHLWDLRKQIFGLGSFQVIIAGIILTLIGLCFDNVSWQTAFVCASGFVLTSTAIVMQVLAERDELGTERGQQMVSILLFEDLLIVPLLAIVSFIAPHQANSAELANQVSVWQEIGTAALALAVLVAAGLWLLNPLFNLLARSKIREIMTATALLVVLGSALLMETGGLSMALGAFVAGVLLSESHFRHQLEADIEPFRGLLLGLFFLGVGMSLNLAVVIENWALILSSVIALMLGKGACIYIVARIAKSSKADAIERAVMMAQGGEFAFVLLAAAAGQNVIDGTTQANMTAVIVLSMALTPLALIAHGRWISPYFTQKSQNEDEIEQQHPTILIGHGRFGQIINELLTACGYQTTVIDYDPQTVAGMNKYGDKTYYGNAERPELLLAAGIEEAKLLIVAIDNKEQALRIVEFAREINPNLHIIARAFDRLHTYALYQAGANEIIRETFDSALRAGTRALESLGVPVNKAKEIKEYYFQRNRKVVEILAEAYDPNIKIFQNMPAMEKAREENRKTIQEITEILNKP